MIVKTTRIDWDIEDDNYEDCEDPSLPQEVTIEVESEEEIVDALSDKYGFCICSLSYTIQG
jgi:hypothetical protein